MRGVVSAFVAVAIISAVAWVSRDRFFRMRPKILEAKVNLAAIRTSEYMYFEKHGVYVAAGPTPLELPGSDRVPWPLRSDTPHGFNVLGWAPEGPTRCQYGVSAKGAAFTAAALCAHNDGTAAWGHVQRAPGESRGIPGPFGRCSPLGVYIGEHLVFETVGPCDDESATLDY